MCTAVLQCSTTFVLNVGSMLRTLSPPPLPQLARCTDGISTWPQESHGLPDNDVHPLQYGNQDTPHCCGRQPQVTRGLVSEQLLSLTELARLPYIRTYFCGVQIFALCANEPQTVKINSRENLFWHCFATCIRPTAISWTPKAIKNIVTLILTCAATQNVH